MTQPNTSIIILGAGAPHRGETPAALREARAGMPVLQWVLDAFRASPADVTFVAGYQAEAIRAQYPDLPLVENPDWSQTGSGASLLSAPLNGADELLACYGDILFRAHQVDALFAAPTPITIAWDSAWRRRFAGRSEADLAGCEKVSVADGRAVRLGSDLPPDWADGEFIGLVRFAPEAVAALEALRTRMPDSLRGLHLAGLLEYLRATGLEIGAVDVAGDWAEVNEVRDIAHFVLGTKAETLGRLQGLVRSAVIQDQVAFTVADWQADRAQPLQAVCARFADRPVVVRSSARSEDSFTSANAGAYTSVLGVDPGNGLEAAVEQVIASYGTAAPEDQVLVQPMVADVVMSGVAFTRTLEQGAPWYVINYETDGDTEGITSGGSGEHYTLMLRRGADPAGLADTRLAAVVAALREIEALLGYDALDVEFALDGTGQVHVLQVRPIAVSHGDPAVADADCDAALAAAHATWQRLAAPAPHLPRAEPLYGVMPDWNPAEIIGTRPGALAESLYRHLIMDEVWATQRAEYGYRDVRPQPLMASFAGRPYVDVRASFASFIPASVPDALAERLLGFYLDWLRARPALHDKVEFEVVPTCLAPGFARWAERLQSAGGFAEDEIEALRTGLHAITREAMQRCARDQAAVETLAVRFAPIEAAELDPLERARLLLADCRRYGTLPFAHLARSGFVAVTLLRTAEEEGVISAAAREAFLSTVRTVSHGLTLDARATATGEMEWAAFVARYGHLRPGTYDITSPRYDADPERFLRPLVAHAMEAELETADAGAWEAERAAFCEALAELDLPAEPAAVEAFLRAAIEGREYAKFVFSRNLSAALEALAEMGESLGLGRETLADIPLESLLAERDSRRPGGDVTARLRAQAQAGREARRIAGCCELPPLITREADLDAFVLGSDLPNFIGSSAVTADCVDLDERAGATEVAVAGRIVLIPQADPGYDWLFGQGIAGLITLFGGANSHMAIRAAEFGLPAAIGVGEQRYRALAAARVIELDPAGRTLRVVQ